MLDKFKKHIKILLPKSNKIIVGVSGGIDSMVLSDLLIKTKINFSIAHVNYNLRGKDSLEDELFIKKYCKKNLIKFYSKSHHFSLNKGSIQEKCRKIRYKYFRDLCLRHRYDFILTAHHLDDNIETLLINVYRGKKVDVFTGIEEVNKDVVRPLLIFSKDDIIDYAKKNKIKWREDKSNSQNIYLRNKIRNKLIPKIKSIDPNYQINFVDLIKKSKKQREKNINYLAQLEKSYFKTHKSGIIESKKNLWKKYNIKSVEFILFRKYGFYKNSEIIKIIKAQTGKKIVSKTHEILSDRNSILIKEISIEINKTYDLNIGINNKPIKIILEKSKKSQKSNKKNIYIDRNVNMPLKIRRFVSGDIFYPNGLKGKKKVSKFFKDEKLSIFEKQKKWILTDANNQILWIIGMRVDRRLIKTSGECLKVSI